MTSPTVSTTLTAPEQQLEDWRDQMIELGISAYWAYETTGQIDTQAAATVANAMNDIRVRDCLVWHMSRYSCPDLVTPILNEAIPVLPQKFAAAAANVACIAFCMQGLESEAQFASAFAINYNPQNNMSLLTALTLAGMGCEGVEKAIREIMETLSYDEVRCPQK